MSTAIAARRPGRPGSPDPDGHKDRVFALAQALVDREVRPTARAIFESQPATNRLTLQQVQVARTKLVDAHRWPVPLGRQPGPAPSPLKALSGIQARVHAEAVILAADGLQPSVEAIVGRLAGEDCPRPLQVRDAIRHLRNKGYWSDLGRLSPAPAGPAARAPREPHVYLGPFARHMKQAARIHRKQKRLLELARGRRGAAPDA